MGVINTKDKKSKSNDNPSKWDSLNTRTRSSSEINKYKIPSYKPLPLK